MTINRLLSVVQVFLLMDNQGKKCNKETIEDWKFNINRANEIVRLYGYQTAYFVKITLSLIATYNILYVIFNIFFYSFYIFLFIILKLNSYPYNFINSNLIL